MKTRRLHLVIEEASKIVAERAGPCVQPADRIPAGSAPFEEIEVTIGERLFVLGGEVTWWASAATDDEGAPVATGQDVLIETLEEAQPENEAGDVLAAPVAEPERSQLLAEHRARFEEAILDDMQGKAEQADEDRMSR